MKKATDNRRAGYKFQGMTTDELRRRREENQVEIRKSKREETLNKRRNLPVPSLAAEAAQPSALEATMSENDDLMLEDYSTTSTVSVAQLETVSQGLFSNDVTVQLEAMVNLRKALSTDRHEPPIDRVIQLGLLSRIIDLLGNSISTLGSSEAGDRLQFEAAWVLTNVASGNSRQTQSVVEAGAVPILAQLLSHPTSVDVREQSVWALGNISGDCPPLRDYCLQLDVMSPLLTILHQELVQGVGRLSLVRNCTWAISNMCRGKPSPVWMQVAPALPVLSLVIHTCLDEETLADACWALSYLADCSTDQISEVIQSGVVSRLVQLLSMPNHTVQTPALRALGNIVTGNDQQTQVVIDNGLLTAVRPLIAMSVRPALIKEACWAVSNITAGTPAQIDQVMQANLIPPLIQVLSTGEFRAKKEACWALCNATSAHQQHPHQVAHLVEQGVLRPLLQILNGHENRIIQVALDGLDNILSVGVRASLNHPDGLNPYALLVEEAGGLDTIYNLQHHENKLIYEKSKGIIDKYFGQDEDADTAHLAMPNDFTFDGSSMAPPQGGFSF